MADSEFFNLDFPRALGVPKAVADFRATPEDFQVVEQLGFAPSGSGEHVFLHIRKRGENTQWVADRIADFAGVKRQDVGFAGLKDRWAVTSQWFSVYLPKGPEPHWPDLAKGEDFDVELLEVARHHQKLRRGTHAGNRFSICLTQVVAGEDLPERLRAISESGAPNYFAEQRFGRDGHNLILAAQWLEQGKAIRSRKLRGLVMSAARSWLFNQVLAGRVAQGNWRRPLAGEALCDGEASGPLWGRGRPAAEADAGALEADVLEPWRAWRDGLEHCGLAQERRALALHPRNLDWRFEGDALTLNFDLAPGQFATAVLRELATLNVPADPRKGAEPGHAGDVV